tara:strand:- start:638 stop:922 length:285 start_codon:yes stop_codon:yes gene_type:complete
MANSDVKAFNFDQGSSAAVVGPARARIRQVVIFAAASGAVTIKNGTNSGTSLLVQSFPEGFHTVNIPDNGILATDGAFVSSFSGSGNKLTIFIS